MLDIKVSVLHEEDRDSISLRYQEGCACAVSDAITAVKQAHALRELSSRRGAASGHKAWISVNADDAGMMLYFMGPTVDFELSRKTVPEDDAYCNGELPYNAISELLNLLDTRVDPIDYLKEVSLTIDCSPPDSR